MLQIFTYVQFDECCHLLNIPGLYLICDEASDVAFLILDKDLKDYHHASVDIGAKLRFARKLVANINQKVTKVRF